MAPKQRSFTTVLIANRGEIACRLITACHAAGLRAIAVYSEADAQARHVRLADRAVLIGPGPVAESYLNPEKILAAARESGAEAIHPGYGFLSENAKFAEMVQAAGLVWIGPSPETIRLMGNKVEAKRIAEKAKVPTLPWAILEENWKQEHLEAAAKNVGFPLLLKAAAGGGGRGMRLVEKQSELLDKAQAAVREAAGAFGSGEIFLERFCAIARHIEVQIVGDGKGNVVTLGERECSVQRRHQKVIEEAPAPNLGEKTRKALWKAASDLARQVHYLNAGTCEFLVDQDENFFFLEMNTRLQVEHPVTELVWGVDLPVVQFHIAHGRPLGDLLPPQLSPRGHAIEARVYAEDPSKNFMPAPGKLSQFSMPQLSHLRVDAGYETGSEVPLYYDAMLAKVIAWGMTREEARSVLVRGLRETVVSGVAWNGPYLADILQHRRFIDGNVNTGFLSQEFSGWKGQVRTEPAKPVEPAAAAPAIQYTTHGGFVSPWAAFGAGSGKVQFAGGTAAAHAGHDSARSISAQAAAALAGPLLAEYPGKVLKVLVQAGQAVEEGQVVVTCESMKMEYEYAAPCATKVRSIEVSESQVIAAGTVLVHWEESV